MVGFVFSRLPDSHANNARLRFLRGQIRVFEDAEFYEAVKIVVLYSSLCKPYITFGCLVCVHGSIFSVILAVPWQLYFRLKVSFVHIAQTTFPQINSTIFLIMGGACRFLFLWRPCPSASVSGHSVCCRAFSGWGLLLLRSQVAFLHSRSRKATWDLRNRRSPATGETLTNGGWQAGP